jgi:hypothetical protein
LRRQPTESTTTIRTFSNDSGVSFSTLFCESNFWRVNKTDVHNFETQEIITSFRDDKTGIVDFLTSTDISREQKNKDGLEDTFFGKFSNFLETTIHGKLIQSERITSKQKLLVKSNSIYHKRYFSLSFQEPLKLFVLRKPLGANFELGKLQESWSTVG